MDLIRVRLPFDTVSRGDDVTIIYERAAAIKLVHVGQPDLPRKFIDEGCVSTHDSTIFVPETTSCKVQNFKQKFLSKKED